MLNNDFYGNTTAPFATTPDGLSVTPYTIAQINALSGSSGNTDGNPTFTSSTDYQLQAGSAAINAATSTGAPTTDINGVTRPQRGGYDIGCYEYTTNIWYLAEGSTTSYVAGVTDGYDTWICVQNPSAAATTVTLTFMDSGGTTATYSQSLAANSRMSYRINDNPGMLNLNEVSTKVESSGGTSIIAERVMYWPEDPTRAKIGGHCSIGTTTTATTWYLAEGSTTSYVAGVTDGYDTWICVQNPSATATTATLTFMDSSGTTATYSQSLAANSRMSYRINDNLTMANKNEVSTKVESSGSVGVIAERTMYWPEGVSRAKAGGHCSIGTPTTNDTWYLAEGSTNGYDTWICVQNPSATATTVTLTYMDGSGNTAVVTQSLAANSRMSKRINDTTSMNNKNDVSTKVEASASVGIVAERVMYWPAGVGVNKTEGHCSIGTPATSTNWYLAEGSTSGYDTWICVQNPGATATTVTLTYMDGSGNTAVVTDTLSANSRLSKRINDTAAMNNLNDVSTQVTSSASVGIIAERVMYWPEGVGVSKTGGHCSIGSRN